jgi:plasmid stability protein
LVVNWKAATDPAERYKELVESSAATSPELSASALEPVIRDLPEDEAIAELSSRIARRGSLTAVAARPLMRAAISGADTPETKAVAASSAISAATRASGEVELSDPVMLNPGLRVFFAIVLCAALGGCIWRLAVLGETKGSAESAIVALAVVAALCLIGVIVLAMGYKNVTIKGGG